MYIFVEINRITNPIYSIIICICIVYIYLYKLYNNIQYITANNI